MPHPIMRHVPMRLFGIAKYAHTPLTLQIFGRPLYTGVSDTSAFSYQIVPCGHMRWICACLRIKYKDDIRHEEYKPIWLEISQKT